MASEVANLPKELKGAKNYPSRRFNQRERRLLKVANASCAAVAVTYDFATMGGAISSIRTGIYLPDNAVILETLHDVITAPDSGDDLGTIRLTTATDGVLTAAITADGAASGMNQIIDETSGGVTIPKKLTAERELLIAIATTALTAGKVRFIVRYAESL